MDPFVRNSSVSADYVSGLDRQGGPLPFIFLQRIQALNGNDVCFDCGVNDPDWASVSHGTLVCLKCAGRHRTLGVHVSRIKSLTMDAWEPPHVAAMLLSGNKQVKDFFTKSNIQNSPMEDLYRHTRAADFYRKKLQEQVAINMDKVENGLQCVLDEVPFDPASPTRRHHSRESSSSSIHSEDASSTGGSSFDSRVTTDGGSLDASGMAAEHYQAVITTQDLGLTLHREVTPFGNLSRVTRVEAGGDAHSAGVVKGDYVVGAGGRMTRDYDELAAVLAHHNVRPLHLALTRPPELVLSVGHAPALRHDPAALARLYNSHSAPSSPTSSSSPGGGSGGGAAAAPRVVPVVQRAPGAMPRGSSGGSGGGARPPHVPGTGTPFLSPGPSAENSTQASPSTSALSSLAPSPMSSPLSGTQGHKAAAAAAAAGGGGGAQGMSGEGCSGDAGGGVANSALETILSRSPSASTSSSSSSPPPVDASAVAAKLAAALEASATGEDDDEGEEEEEDEDVFEGEPLGGEEEDKEEDAYGVALAEKQKLELELSPEERQEAEREMHKRIGALFLAGEPKEGEGGGEGGSANDDPAEEAALRACPFQRGQAVYVLQGDDGDAAEAPAAASKEKGVAKEEEGEEEVALSPQPESTTVPGSSPIDAPDPKLLNLFDTSSGEDPAAAAVAAAGGGSPSLKEAVLEVEAGDGGVGNEASAAPPATPDPPAKESESAPRQPRRWRWARVVEVHRKQVAPAQAPAPADSGGEAASATAQEGAGEAAAEGESATGPASSEAGKEGEAAEWVVTVRYASSESGAGCGGGGGGREDDGGGTEGLSVVVETDVSLHRLKLASDVARAKEEKQMKKKKKKSATFARPQEENGNGAAAATTTTAEPSWLSSSLPDEAATVTSSGEVGAAAAAGAAAAVVPDWLKQQPDSPADGSGNPGGGSAANGGGTLKPEIKFGDEFQVTFSSPRMGFRMQKEPQTGHAVVTHVVPYEAASSGGVKVGDLVVGMEGAPMPYYDTLMAWLHQSPRPLRMSFKKRSDPPPAEKIVLGAADLTAARIRSPPAASSSSSPGAYPGYPGYPGYPDPRQQQQQQQHYSQQQQFPPPPGGGGPAPPYQHPQAAAPYPQQHPSLAGHHPLAPPGQGQPSYVHQRVGELPPPGTRRGYRPGASPIAEALGTAGGLMVKAVSELIDEASKPYTPTVNNPAAAAAFAQSQQQQGGGGGRAPFQYGGASPTPPPWQHQPQHQPPPWQQQQKQHQAPPPPWGQPQHQPPPPGGFRGPPGPPPRRVAPPGGGGGMPGIAAPQSSPGAVGAQYSFPANIVPPTGTAMTTKVDVGDLTEADEVDITFMAGPLGMRLDERGDWRLVPVSIVTSIVPEGQAALAGVEIGCTVVGVNGERYISHAHTISTLKHGRRPIKLRLRFPDA